MFLRHHRKQQIFEKLKKLTNQVRRKSVFGEEEDDSVISIKGHTTN